MGVVYEPDWPSASSLLLDLIFSGCEGEVIGEKGAKVEGATRQGESLRMGLEEEKWVKKKKRMGKERSPARNR